MLASLLLSHIFVLEDGDISTLCEEPVSSAPCTEAFVKDTQHSVVESSCSKLNSPESSYLVIDEENQHLQDPQVPSISLKDDSFSFNLPKASDGDTNKVSQPFSTSQNLSASGVGYSFYKNSIFSSTLCFLSIRNCFYVS